MMAPDFVLSISFACPFCAEATERHHYALARNDAIEHVVAGHAEHVGRGYSGWELSEEARVEASKQLDEAVDEMVRQEEGAWEQVWDEERESLLSQGRQCFDPIDSRFLFED
jgi:hypothetical protein